MSILYIEVSSLTNQIDNLPLFTTFLDILFYIQYIQIAHNHELLKTISLAILPKIIIQFFKNSITGLSVDF